MGENFVSFRVLALFYFALCLGLILFFLLLGPVDQHLFAPDCFGFLASGWDVLLGYRPYVDFQVDTGLTPVLFVALGEYLSDYGPLALPLSVVIPLIPLSLVIWYFISSYFRSTVGIIMAVYLVLLWCDPVPLHFYFYNGSYANYYNRESYTILSLLMIVLCGRPQKEIWRSKLEIGLLLGLLLFFKITYFIAALFLVGGTLLTKKLSVRELAYIGGGFLITALPMVAYIGVDGLWAMIQVLHEMGIVRSADLIENGFKLVAYEGVAYLLVFGMFMWGFKIKPTVESALVLVAAYICEFGGCPSFEWIDCPLLAIYALILFSRCFNPKNELKEEPHVVGIVGLSWLFMPSIANLFLGILYPLFLHNYYEINEVRMVQSERCGLKIHIAVAQDINDGLDMLRKHMKAEPNQEHCITAIDFCDPFSYALGTRSARFMLATPSVGVNLDATHHPAPEHLFSGVDWVMEPRRPMSDKPVNTYVPDFMNYVRAHYQMVDHSTYWIMWELKQK